MRTFILALFGLLILVSAGSAYYINFDAPDSLAAGEPLNITGESTLPPGFSTELVLYRLSPSVREMARETITIQEDGSWSLIIDTTGYAAGRYKFEIAEKAYWEDGEYRVYEYGSGSDTLHTFTIVDRSGELTISAPLSQRYDGTLQLAGKVAGLGDAGVKITVEGPSGTVFGPQYIQTDKEGRFSREIAIEEGGAFQVRFEDRKGFIHTVTFTVTGYATPTETAAPTSAPPLTAAGEASREIPAYFTIDTEPGTVTIESSTGTDWILEFVEENANERTVNEQGTVSPERITYEAGGEEVYVKAYPVQYAVTSTITLSVQNAESVTLDPAAATAFGDTPPATPTQATPLGPAVALAALVILCISRKFP
ncbi:MAG: hypothetical protein RQ758_04070 [Methanomicrobiaceae archaeon]|nr:hypothetical protein [Methanomicrobiaceae archaeon]